MNYTESKKLKVLLLLSFISFSFAINSCTFKEPAMPSSRGGTSEILVISEKYHWEGQVGKTIKNHFKKIQLGLPQAEPIFKTIQLSEDKLSSMLKAHRNLFIVDIKKNKQVKISAKKNVWARPQIVIKITAPDTASFIKAFNQHAERCIEYFNKNERKRITNAYKQTLNRDIHTKLKRMFGATMILPSGFYIAKADSNFIWLRMEPKNYSQGIMVSSYNYTDTMAWGHKNIIDYRNTITKKHIPGRVDGSYMITSRIINPIFSEVNLNDNYAIETRGLWDVEGDFMGGPFLSYTLLDKKRSRIITIDGYVFAPRYKKRDYLRQIEAILHSIKFTNTK